MLIAKRTAQIQFTLNLISLTAPKKKVVIASVSVRGKMELVIEGPTNDPVIAQSTT